MNTFWNVCDEQDLLRRAAYRGSYPAVAIRFGFRPSCRVEVTTEMLQKIKCKVTEPIVVHIAHGIRAQLPQPATLHYSS